MLYANETTNTSVKALKNALSCIDNLTEAAAEAAAIFRTYQVLVEETGIPADSQVIEECSQMFATMNKMMLRQKADLQHVCMMKKSMAESEKLTHDMIRKIKKSDKAVAVA